MCLQHTNSELPMCVCATPHHWCHCRLQFVVVLGENKVISLESCCQDKSDVHCIIFFLLQFFSPVLAVFMLFAATVSSPILGREIISSWFSFEGEGYLSSSHGVLGWKSCGFADPCDYIVLCNFVLLGCLLYAISLFPYGGHIILILMQTSELSGSRVLYPDNATKMLTYSSCLHCFSVLIFKLELSVWWWMFYNS